MKNFNQLKNFVPTPLDLDDLINKLSDNDISINDFEMLTQINLNAIKNSFVVQQMLPVLTYFVCKLIEFKNNIPNENLTLYKSSKEALLGLDINNDMVIVQDALIDLINSNVSISLTSLSNKTALPPVRILRVLKEDEELMKLYSDNKEAEELMLYEKSLDTARAESIATGNKFTNMILDKSISKLLSKKMEGFSLNKKDGGFNVVVPEGGTTNILVQN